MKTKFNNSGAVVCEMSSSEYDALVWKARALHVATTGLRELREKYAGGYSGGHPLGSFFVDDLTALLDKVGATRDND